MVDVIRGTTDEERRVLDTARQVLSQPGFGLEAGETLAQTLSKEVGKTAEEITEILKPVKQRIKLI